MAQISENEPILEGSEEVPVAAEFVPSFMTTSEHTVIFRKIDDTRVVVSWFGNMLWIWFAGGFVISAVYAIFGVLLLCTVLLAPFGLQLLKIAQFALFPFGKEVETCSCDGSCSSCVAVALNLVWLPIGIVLVLFHLLAGILCACTCYGIIFTFQHIKLAQMALLPFGALESDKWLHEGNVTRTETTTTTRQFGSLDQVYEDNGKGSSYGSIRNGF